MSEKHLFQIKFGSFMKLNTLIFLSLGIVFAILGFILSLTGGEITATIGNNQLTGVQAGLVNLILFPLVFAFFGALSSLVAFFPFRLMLRILKGIKFEAEFK